MSEWLPLTVTSVVAETEVDKSFVFDLPHALRDRFRWRAGQHVVVRRTVDGEAHRRCYSLSSSPGDAPRITVRRLRGGQVSGDLHAQIVAGSTLEVSAPCGAFCLDASATAYRTHYAFAAGSGITPIRSMLGAVLADEPYSVVHLLYGNRSLDQILFRDELDALVERDPRRLTITHTLTSPPWLRSFDGWRGRIDAEVVRRFVDGHTPIAQDAHYWICGPGTMNATVRQALMTIDVPAERIHAEAFGSPTPAEIGRPVGVGARLDVERGGQRSSVEVDAGETLLDAMRRRGVRPPHACMAGVCSTCRARLIAGAVEHRARMALDDRELSEGWVLTCQAVPTSDRVALRYD
ncbi:MAG: ferredoxin--NADP reductase [Acidobacteriota bacterium]